MNRVFGEGGFDVKGLMLRTIRNLEFDVWKDLRAVSSCGKMLRKELDGIVMAEETVINILTTAGETICKGLFFEIYFEKRES